MSCIHNVTQPPPPPKKICPNGVSTCYVLHSVLAGYVTWKAISSGQHISSMPLLENVDSKVASAFTLLFTCRITVYQCLEKGISAENVHHGLGVCSPHHHPLLPPPPPPPKKKKKNSGLKWCTLACSLLHFGHYFSVHFQCNHHINKLFSKL